MGRGLWLLALVVAFVLGLVAGGAALKGQPRVPEADGLQETVSRLQQQVGMLQARLRARESSTGPGQSGVAAHADGRQAARIGAATMTEELMPPGRPTRAGGAAQLQGESQTDRASSPGAPPATVEAALDRFYRYLEATRGAEGRERWQRGRELVEDLRSMGDAGAKALMHVLASGSDSDERRAAARLLGTLQVPEALPLLRDIIEKDSDLLLRQAAASGLRQLQTADSVPVMERILANPGEDRFVRLSAAYGLAESGKQLGVTGLAQIFEESTADGRGRALAFRALASLNDERSLPFMRQLVTSQAEPSYRLQAIRYLTTQGDQQALGALRVVMQSPSEQPSIRDAAAQAYRVIGGR